MDFYNAISVLYGSLEDYCTPKTCPAMAAGSKVASRRLVLLSQVAQDKLLRVMKKDQ